MTRGTVETYTPAMYNVKELEMVVVSDLNKLCHRDKIKVNDRNNKTQLLEKLTRFGRQWWLEIIAEFQAPTVSPPACAIHGCEMKAERDVKANKAKLNEMYRWRCPHARCTQRRSYVWEAHGVSGYPVDILNGVDPEPYRQDQITRNLNALNGMS